MDVNYYNALDLSICCTAQETTIDCIYCQNNPLDKLLTCLQGMVNQRPGALLDTLVGIPGDAQSVEASLVNYYLHRIEEVSNCDHCTSTARAILRTKTVLVAPHVASCQGLSHMLMARTCKTSSSI